MPELTIESNGLLDKTAVYYNGEQIGGIKELFLNLDEEGTFDSIIKYEGIDKNLYTKNVFSDYLDNLKTKEPTFTEEEAMGLQSITIDSDGDIENTVILRNGEEEFGIVSLFLHFKSPETSKTTIFSKAKTTERAEFKAQITYRNDDESLDMEEIF